MSPSPYSRLISQSDIEMRKCRGKLSLFNRVIKFLAIVVVTMLGLSIVGYCILNVTRHIASFPELSSNNCAVDPGERIDCGYIGITENECNSRGCCWNPVHSDHSAWCFHKSKQCDGYVANNFTETESGMIATLEILNRHCSRFGKNVETLMVSFDFETLERVHVKITDYKNSRYEIPESVFPRPSRRQINVAMAEYEFQKTDAGTNMIVTKENENIRVVVTSRPFNFWIVRKIDGHVMFNSSSGASDVLVFEDQYLEISTGLAKETSVYGLGEIVRPFLLKPGARTTIFARDAPSPDNENIYGGHPFYLAVNSGSAHGVFLLNSNAMDIIYEHRNAITYKITGGILDFYIFIGPSPKQVISQYHQVIGLAAMMPYWSLGFHQCRYGYRSVEEIDHVVDRFAQENIPLEVMWTDIEYMDGYKDFTFDPVNYPVAKMRKFVDKLHSNGQKYTVIVDPGIKIDPGLPSYDEGISLDLFIKNVHGSPLVGKVWPGLVHFPDFFHPSTQGYWTRQFGQFLDLVNVDGVWIDMNELANFCDGDCFRPPLYNDLNFPPYKINNAGRHAPLHSRTTPMDAKHYGDYTEYNVHNLYGHMEAIATYNSMISLRPNKRPFILSRSTFAGSGRYTAHWTGDNWSNWNNLYYSVAGILNFNMFGIPMVGADICGFGGDTTEELCARWMAMGAFYPFSRNHNEISAISQEPYLWESVANVSRKYLAIRYSLLPYYYTLMYEAHAFGSTIVRPLFFEFPLDQETLSIDTQFMVGSGLMVSPVLHPGVDFVNAYFPNEMWYDLNGHILTDDPNAHYQVLDAPLQELPLHYKGGSIIPTQEFAMTVNQVREKPFTLIIALDLNGNSIGTLYYDDGESIDVEGNASYINLDAHFKPTEGILNCNGLFGYSDMPKLATMKIMGALFKPRSVALNGRMMRSINVSYENKVAVIKGLDMTLDGPFIISFNE